MNFVFHLHLKGTVWSNDELTGAPTFASKAETLRWKDSSWESAKQTAKNILTYRGDKAVGGNLCLDTEGRHVDTLNAEERTIVSFTVKA
jgi:hypothetical protein